jgi:hypothetical protein
MPGDPNECRERARHCAEAARIANAPEERELFASLAQSWTRLAAELEEAQVFLNTMAQVEAAGSDKSQPACGAQRG